MDDNLNREIWTLARFIQAAEDYNFHLAEVELKQLIYNDAVSRGLNPQQIEAIGVLNQIAEHEQQVSINETTLRQFIDRFPRLISHWAVSEYELNFLDF